MKISEKQEKAKNLRYKKSIAEGFNFSDMQNEIYEIQECCSDIRYIFDGDEATLIDALDGDEEEAYEIRMLFSNLSAEAETLSGILWDRNSEIQDFFDDFFAAVVYGSQELIGFDSYEDDYFKMTAYEQEWGSEEAKKRLLKRTKEDIVSLARTCFGIASAMLNIRYKFDYLKASVDVIKEKNTSFLQSIRDIEKAYEEANKENFNPRVEATTVLNRMIDAMPNRVWVE